MAEYGFSVKHGSKADDKSAGAHARYISRSGKYEYRDEDLKHTESGNIPHWAKDDIDYWDATDKYGRANERHSKWTITLPRELTDKQNLELVRGFIKEELGESCPFTMAIHESSAADGLSNPHAHVVYSTRDVNDGYGHLRDETTFFKKARSDKPELGGARKDRTWNVKGKVDELRLSWENHCNNALKKAGHDVRVSCLSNEAQGKDPPEEKLTPYEGYLWKKKGIISEKVARNLEKRKLAKERRTLKDTEKHLVSVQELGDLAKDENGWSKVLQQETELLEIVNQEIVEMDSKIERLGDLLDKMPGSLKAAVQMAHDREFGAASNAHDEMVEEAKKERDERANEIASSGVSGALLSISSTVRELNDLWEAQRVLDDARKARERFGEFIEDNFDMVEEVAKGIFSEKEEIEGDRNEILKEAIEARHQKEGHSDRISEAEEALAKINNRLDEVMTSLPLSIQHELDPKRLEEQLSVAPAIGQSDEKLAQELEERKRVLEESKKKGQQVRLNQSISMKRTTVKA